MMITQILKEFLLMAWDIFWPLALGFIASALIRTFISMKTVTDSLGKSNLKGLGLATGFGAISSSCSYAAASMSRTLIIKGASWSNAIAFMIASTNLVFEIFLVIVTLLGWPFFAGEILGGIVFIIIGAIMIKWLMRDSIIRKAKAHIEETEAAVSANDPHAHHHGMAAEHDHSQSTDHDHASAGEHHQEHEHHHHHEHGVGRPSTAWQGKLKEAAGYFYMDVIMVGKDILIGVIIASIFAVIIPPHFWKTLFLQDNTALPQLLVVIWNNIIGIIVALMAFVCSVGNILLAAVLWHGGINFGGVISFILADLITIPMLMVYKRYYGTGMMLRMLLVLSLSILLTSIGIDYVFQAFNWIPQSHGLQLGMQKEAFKWDYNAWLNLLFIPVAIIAFFIGKKGMSGQAMHHH